MLRFLKAAAHLGAGDFDATDDALRQDDRLLLGLALRAILQAGRGDTDSLRRTLPALDEQLSELTRTRGAFLETIHLGYLRRIASESLAARGR
jgi:hypothetical protein